MNHSTLYWYTVQCTIRNNNRHEPIEVLVTAPNAAEAVRRAREHVHSFRRRRIYNPIVTLSSDKNPARII